MFEAEYLRHYVEVLSKKKVFAQKIAYFSQKLRRSQKKNNNKKVFISSVLQDEKKVMTLAHFLTNQK